jgi:metal-responsive CopG/Arc/MetJ family transcriptional regulator
MNEVAHVRLRPDLLQRVDEAAVAELRTRSNMVARLVDEGLRRRESADTKKEGQTS